MSCGISYHISSEIYFGILYRIASWISFGIFSDNTSGIFFGILYSIPSGIYFGIFKLKIDFHPAYIFIYFELLLCNHCQQKMLSLKEKFPIYCVQEPARGVFNSRRYNETCALITYPDDVGLHCPSARPVSHFQSCNRDKSPSYSVIKEYIFTEKNFVP